MDRFVVAEIDAGQRLDVFAAEKSGLTRSYIKQLLTGGKLTLNGETKKAGYVLKTGDTVEIDAPVIESEIIPEDIPIDIIYEDDDLAVINKAQGITVHPAGGNKTGTLVNALLYALKNLSGINGELRPGIVHRLDKDTSGLIVVAKNDMAHLKLSAQFAKRSVYKEYVALLTGTIKKDKGSITTQIGRSPSDRKKMAVVAGGGREAVTDYEVLSRGNGYTYAKFVLHTGRTHQIRVHAAFLGAPVAGDSLYGVKKGKFLGDGQYLHSFCLEFNHPVSGQRMKFTAPLPEKFKEALVKAGIATT